MNDQPTGCWIQATDLEPIVATEQRLTALQVVAVVVTADDAILLLDPLQRVVGVAPIHVHLFRSSESLK